MDVTPQLLKDVEFRERFRGYDQDEVDDFLERVADGVGQLVDRLRQATLRAEEAEARAAQAEARARDSGDDDTLRRTLVLAQRTADAAVAEAEEESGRLLGEAQEQRTRLLAEAQEQSARLVGEAQEQLARAIAEAESEARRAADDTRRRLQEEVAALEESRTSLQTDLGVLERHLSEQRLRLRSSLEELQQLLEHPERLRVDLPEELRSPVLPEVDAAEAALPLEAPARRPLSARPAPIPPVAGEVADPLAAATSHPVAGEVADPPAPATSHPVAGPGEPTVDSGEGGPGSEAPEPDVPRRPTEPPSNGGPRPDPLANAEIDPLGADAGPPTAPFLVRPGDDDDDAYLAELRKAMTDEEPLGPRDELELEAASSLLFDQDRVPEESSARLRFGRRR